MFQLIYLLVDMICPTVLIPPLMILFGHKKGYAWDRIILFILFSLYIAGVYHMTGLPDIYYHRYEPNIYLLAFLGIADDVRNSILNVLLFMPMGLALPMLWDSFRSIPKTALFGLVTSLVIELMQIFTFRTTDINDLITNVLGTVLGWILAEKIPCRKNACKAGSIQDILIPAGTAFAVMFFIEPFVFTFLWEWIM